MDSRLNEWEDKTRLMIRDSELILNPDGSIYHLCLLPEDLADIVITVGDPDRVEKVSRHFDRLELSKENREFRTHTGYLADKRISVVSTGIGPDNIDIVSNELDALVNIDFKTRQVKSVLKQLKLIRIGTSGGLQPDLPLDSTVYSAYALGFDNLLYYYQGGDQEHAQILKSFLEDTQWEQSNIPRPYVSRGSKTLALSLGMDEIQNGFTATNVGFYGPQGRNLRLLPSDGQLLDRLSRFQYQDLRILNLEMETAAIYGMAQLLGHQAVSLSVILANRSSGTFSDDPESAISDLIRFTLDRIIKSDI